MSYPRLEVDITKLCYNADTVLGWCREHGIEAAFVGKCVLADRRILNAVLPRGFTAYADSREDNLENVEYDTPRILLLADRADVENAYTASSPSPYFFEEALYIIREYMSYVYLFLFE